ncbi:hypothetical protein BC937DRAFT_87844 [Endogone sp. FLAS-F59071]|nr:hypothetical protein BC937DRAFT_87844 [Endogone sp. FLAS-F59071]|eukprot:RUS12457.1 hypothetical protein BC937DRAFT_87844 [Endogone sp. FLAS-F59071]
MYLSVETQSAFPYPAFRDHFVPLHSSSFAMIQPHPYQPQLATYTQPSSLAAAQQAQNAAAATQQQQPSNPPSAQQPLTTQTQQQQPPPQQSSQQQQQQQQQQQHYVGSAAVPSGTSSKPPSQPPNAEPTPNANSTSTTPVNIPQLADFASAMVFAMWHARKPSLAVLYNSSPPPTSPVNSTSGSPTTPTPTPVQHRQSASMATSASPAFKKFCLQVSAALD